MSGIPDNSLGTAAVLMDHKPRISLATGTVDNMAFPAGIVRGESCSIARLTGVCTVFDVDRRLQNVSYDVAAGLIKQEVEDDAIADPLGTGSIVEAPDPLVDLRASWLWHRQTQFNPTSAGNGLQVFNVELKCSRLFVAPGPTVYDGTGAR